MNNTNCRRSWRHRTPECSAFSGAQHCPASQIQHLLTCFFLALGRWNLLTNQSSQQSWKKCILLWSSSLHQLNFSPPSRVVGETAQSCSARPSLTLASVVPSTSKWTWRNQCTRTWLTSWRYLKAFKRETNLEQPCIFDRWFLLIQSMIDDFTLFLLICQQPNLVVYVSISYVLYGSESSGWRCGGSRGCEGGSRGEPGPGGGGGQTLKQANHDI